MTATVTITNEEKLIRKLTRIPEAMRLKIRDAMADEADEMVAMMKRLVPVEPGKPDLKDSIGWRWGARAPAGSASVGQVRAPSEFGSTLTLTIYAANDQTFYGTFVEFGTSKMAARPFFFPSYRARRKEAKRAMRAAVRAAARQVAAGG
jgi:HK97 gp10 family phage protein